METARDVLGILGLVLMLAGVAGVIAWLTSTLRQRYPRLGAIGFGVAVLGLVIWLLGGYSGLLG